MGRTVPMTIVVLFMFGAVCAMFITGAEALKEEPSEFNSVLAALIQQGMDHIAQYDQFKHAIQILKNEHKSSNQEVGDKKKRAKPGKDDWSGAVNDLVDTVDAFFGDSKQPTERRQAKQADEVGEIFAEYKQFKADLKKFKFDYWRLARITRLTLEAMNRRPKLRKNIADGVAEMFSIPKNIAVNEWLTIVSQTVAMWNTPLGQKLFKPFLDNIANNFLKSNFDVNALKPSVDMLLVTIMGAEAHRQVQPAVDVGFRVVDMIVKLLHKSGLSKMFQYADPSKTLRAVQEAYVEVMLDTIDPLQEVLKSTDQVVDGLNNVLDVTRRYRNVPGTMDVRFQRGYVNDPFAKVKQIVTQIEQTKEVIQESTEAITGFRAYPLHHPSQAIDAAKLLVRKLKAGHQALDDFWPLRGFLTTHPVVQAHKDMQRQVEELRMNTKRAVDKTHKVQTLIKDMQNLDSIFDVKKVYEDVIAILRGYPKLGFLLGFLDMFRGEFDKLKEIAFDGY